ncbi:alpha/beta hydrolase [Winogradskyella jejuensis]|uniref:Serine aminopeptidase S33 domain-containing protein n=1 Tax=Winogradskyella jejuensis TaxID=1089305 RepID=A0A1M5K2X8_9FLAO|nr:alpha/beta hydrolase [Winogradskyella jejuensis]SHG46930.1 hypothetical protein SAMN05444148_0209 [Winogradskyella jejuensis]
MKKINFILFALSFALSYSQNIVSEDILIKNDSIDLPGTLSYDKSIVQQPLIIFIHGSGNIDRNGNAFGAPGKSDSVKQLSEALNKEGIAFYRYDKRSANMKNLRLIMKEGVNLNDFVDDAKLAIQKFKDDKRFSTITVIGHSQGSLIGMLLLDAGVNKYISLAGPSNTIDKTITEQVRMQNGDSIASLVSNHFKELKETGRIENVDPNLLLFFNKTNQGFFKSWIAYDPIEEMAKVNKPTLIINGTKDIQVFEADAKALHQANPKAKLVIIENMNHALKTITKDEDNLKSYNTPDFPLSEDLVKAITTFVKK